MGNLNTAVTIDKKNCYMASAVILNAYFSPPVSLVLLSLVLISLHQCQKYCFLLRTNFKILYLYTKWSPICERIFTKLMKYVFSYHRKLGYEIMVFLDGSVICGDSYKQCIYYAVM